LVLLVYTIEGTATYGWASTQTLVSLGLAAALLAGFLLVERLVQRPLLPPATWRNRSLLSGVGMMLGVSGIMGAAFFLNSLYLQGVMGATALQTGLAFVPFAAVIFVASHLGSRLVAHLGTRSVLVLGLLATAGGVLLLARVPDQPTFVADLLPGFVALGAGLGLAFVAIAVTVMADVNSEQAGVASALMMTGHELGAALGVALFSAVASARSVQSGFTAGYSEALVAAAIVAVVLTLLSLLAVPVVRPVGGAARAAMHGG
jgi:predicted MFS family arabinose efflux permease